MGIGERRWFFSTLKFLTTSGWRDAAPQQHGGKYAVRRIAFWPICPHDVDTDRWTLSPGRVNERGQAVNVLAHVIRTKGIRKTALVLVSSTLMFSLSLLGLSTASPPTRPL